MYLGSTVLQGVKMKLWPFKGIKFFNISHTTDQKNATGKVLSVNGKPVQEQKQIETTSFFGGLVETVDSGTKIVAQITVEGSVYIDNLKTADEVFVALKTVHNTIQINVDVNLVPYGPMTNVKTFLAYKYLIMRIEAKLQELLQKEVPK